MKKFRLSILLLLVMSLFLSASNVFAETSGNTITEDGPKEIGERIGIPGINILDTSSIVFTDDSGAVIENPDINSKVNIRFNWSFENSEAILIQDGDYFTFKLPEDFKINTEMSGNLGEYGVFTIDTQGNVNFTFNEMVNQNSNVHGYIEFSARLNEEIVGDPGEKVIELPISENSEFRFNVTPTIKDTSIDKTGSFDKELNPGYITWEVKINKAYETLNDVVVTDVIPTGLTLEEIEVVPLNLNHDGSFKSYGDKLTTIMYVVNGSEVRFNTSINQPYAIRYITKIDDSIKPNDGGEVEFKNFATMTSNENEEITTDSTIFAKYGKLLTKTKPSYNANEQSFTWTVEYNYGEKTIVNPLLVDIFDEDLEYVEGSLVITNSKNQKVEYDYTLTNSPKNKLDIQFNEAVSEALKISYKTKVKAGRLVLENEDFENSISTGGTTSGNTGTARPRMIIKSSPAIDYQNKRIDWQIDVNINRYEMHDYQLIDTYLYRGLSLLDSSFEVYDVTANKVVEASNYDFVKTTEAGVEIGFTLLFKGDYATTSSQLEVRFTTDYDVNDLIAGNGSTFRNHVKLEWTDQYDNRHSHSSQADRGVNSQTVNNGQKSGSYNAVSKEITWKVDVNYNSENLINAKIVDRMQDGQTFVENSLIIRTYTVNSDGTLTISDESEDLSKFVIKYPSQENEYELIISLPNDNEKKYSVEFRTSVENQAVKTNYQNRAVFTNDQYTRNLDASVTVTNGDKFVTKTGNQEGSLIHWSIAINESQSTIKDAEIHDNPSINQILIEESFKLYPVIVQADETYEVDYNNPLQMDTDYSLEINTDLQGKQTFVLKFIDVIERTYVLEYDSQISTTPDDTTISNTVTLKGNEISYEDGNGETSIVIDVNQAGGGAVGVKGKLTIQKIDENGNPLEGVEFELYNPLQRKVATRLTDVEGKIVFQGLVYGDYTIKETQALEGYVISDELFVGKKLIVNEETSDSNHVIVLENRMNSLIIHKTDGDGQALNGAVFKLEVQNEELYELVNQDITITDGSFTLKGLKAGMYRLSELKAPQGYIRNVEPLEFKIEANANGQEIDLSIDFVNYRGSVKLSKTDSLGEALTGVVFDLFDSNDEVILEGLTTDENGEILIENELAPGNYYFKEKESVNGNIVNETPIRFVISNDTSGVPEVVEVKATNFKGSVEFKKTDDKNNGLSGVEFELYYENQSEPYVVVVSDENGVVRVDQLSPGTYQFRESKAQFGYILNTDTINFVVPEKTQNEFVLIELDNFINYKGGVNVRKVDEKGNLLKEATFEIRDDKRNILISKVTENGQVSFDELSPGKYILVETSAPEGYVLEEKETQFEIAEQFEGEYTFSTIDIVNKLKPKLPGEMPTTGVSNDLFYTSLLAIAVGSLLLIISRKKKKHI